MRFLRGVAAVLVVLTGLVVDCGLLLVVLWTFVWSGRDWTLALQQGCYIAGVSLLTVLLATLIWPRKLSHPHRPSN